VLADPNQVFLLPISRDIDTLIEKLLSTIRFFTELEGGNGAQGSEDEFVPFI